MMTIKEYINKNLPNLNWNILPQIFEENEVELTEEIKTYLKNTPWNTNWNVFENLNDKNEEVFFDGMTTVYSMGTPTCQNEYDGQEINIGDQFEVTVNEHTYQFTMSNQGDRNIESDFIAGEPYLGFTNMTPNPPYVWIYHSDDLPTGEKIHIKIVRTKSV